MRNWLWTLVKAVLFKIDPESAHRLTITLIHLGIRMGRVPLILASGGKVKKEPSPEVFQMPFLSRVGLAAGFDKDAEILLGLPDLGFGFAEIGTVTPRPQPGNDRPRLFRDQRQLALFNRMGFNSLGATVVSERLAEVRPQLPENFRVGVNLGKNKETSLEDSAQDYAQAASFFADLADYLVINVSSPNTPGLRSLQTAAALKPIVNGVSEVIGKWKRRPPLLLKLAPEVTGDDLNDLLKEGKSWGIDGWVLTNTLGGSWKTASHSFTGGWSGGPLSQLSRERLLEARAQTSLPIISVGGILSVEEARSRREAGADLVQVYTGWIYRGPSFPRKLSLNLS